jgi:hypothetical protein
LCLTAVGIEHPHAEVGLGGGQNQDETIGANAKVPIAYHPCHDCGVLKVLLKAIDVYVIIAQAVHFGEVHNVFLETIRIRQAAVCCSHSGMFDRC